MSKSKKILVCPLDWGLGHATRLVPVIDQLLKLGADVFIGADNRPFAYLRQRFPECTFIQLPGFSVRYPANGSMALAMIKSYPEMLSTSKKAKLLLEEIIKENKIDIVISDNRYELSSDLAYCVFITHQLNIQTPGLSKVGKPFITKKINSYIRNFDELWIPDFEKEPSLSGKLSHNLKLPVNNFHFVGPLSRFSLVKAKPSSEKPGLLVLLSGPEPQRTLLEELLINQAVHSGIKTTILQGKPESAGSSENRNVKLISHLPDDELVWLIKEAKTIISRPGYSTIMDLAVLGRKAIFIPTPGQTEQEYLANRFMKTGICYYSNQSGFKLDEALKQSEQFIGFAPIKNTPNLEKTIGELFLKSKKTFA
jgi:uncharacterized protein (TIGR00661 family)